MRIAIAGGGPAGLYFAILVKRLDPAHEVVVYERNAPDDTFGFGVVFSDETLDAIEAADPPAFAEIDAPVRALGGDRRPLPRRDDHLRRPRLLGAQPARAPRASCRSARATSASTCASAPRRRPIPTWTCSWAPTASTAACARGTRSPRRFERGRSKYIWLGTDRVFDAFTFYVASTEHGVFQVHGYPYERRDEHVHRRDVRGDVARGRARPGERGGEHRVLRGAVRRRARRPPAARQQLALDRLRHGAQRGLAPRERRAARRRRAHRALLDRLGHEARDGGRDRAGVGVPRARGRRARRARRLRGRAPPDRREHAARRAGQPRVVRGHRALRPPAAADRSRSTCSRAAAASPTASCSCATRLRRARGRARSATRRGRRCSRRSGCASSSSPTASSSRRWTCTRSADGTPGDFHLVHLGARAIGGAGARDDRDDLRLARGADHARAAAACTATSTSTRGSGSSTSCTRTARRRSARSSATRAARARRS